MKLCIKCKHCIRISGWELGCAHPVNTRINLVNGYEECIIDIDCMREPTGECGEDGWLFEERPALSKPKGFWAKLKEDFFILIGSDE